MSRKDLFCRISRMSAIDETIFDDLMGIVKVSKISSPAIFCNYVLKSLYTGFRDDDEVSDTNILARLMKLILPQTVRRLCFPIITTVFFRQ